MDASDIFSLQGQAALVTGASGAIGARFARVLARAGARVYLAARDAARVQPHVDALLAEGLQAAALRLDVTDPAQVEAAFETMETELGQGLDIVVNNAGILHAARFIDETHEGFARLYATNVMGAAAVARRAVRGMQQRRSGSIVNIASTAGLRAPSMLSSYGSSKAALVHLTQAMALELAAKGIRVNALCPGNIESDMHQQLAEHGFDQKIRERIPQRRLGRPEDLDGALLLLASDAGRYITGAVLPVDGGQALSWQ